MTDDEMRIAIATACGWKFGPPGEALRDPQGRLVNAHYSEEWRLPDYLNDLNACHEMEKVLDPTDRLRHGGYLDALRTETAHPLEGSNGWYLVHATPRQRAEAFLRTVGKWRDA